MQFTQDKFLDGALTIRQPANGYRAATDPVFLAAAVDCAPKQSVLDVGCGVGVAALCLGRRVQGVKISGLEIQSDYAELAQFNAQENDIKLQVTCADLGAIPDDLKQQSFDHVITNPPFFEPNRLSPPSDAGKSTAHLETMQLGTWIEHSLKRVKPKGFFYIIQRSERLDEILTPLAKHCGGITILPISARANRVANRVIIRAQKSSLAQTRLLAPFVVHAGEKHGKDGDDYSDLAKSILRDGAKLPLI